MNWTVTRLRRPSNQGSNGISYVPLPHSKKLHRSKADLKSSTSYRKVAPASLAIRTRPLRGDGAKLTSPDTAKGGGDTPVTITVADDMVPILCGERSIPLL